MRNLYAGIDIGSLITKAVIIDDRKLISSHRADSRADPARLSEQAFGETLKRAQAKTEDISFTVATGYGRISCAFADATITELTCHARGSQFANSDVRTIIDIGGQDSKVIKIDSKGKMVDFEMNDKCAAGTGRFLEVMAHALGINIEDIGTISMQSENPCSLSSTCTVFAETEVVSLLAKGINKENIIAGLHMSIAKRVGNMVKRLGPQKEFLFVGGVAKNKGMKTSLEKQLSIRFMALEFDPQIIGALGAALIAREISAQKQTCPSPPSFSFP